MLAAHRIQRHACSSSSSDSGPQATVQEFYRHINGGDYASAMTLYSASALELWDDPSIPADSNFEAWAKVETKKGTVDRVEIVEEMIGEGEATAKVSFQVRYADGSAASHTVELVREDGSWKLGLIG